MVNCFQKYEKTAKEPPAQQAVLSRDKSFDLEEITMSAALILDPQVKRALDAGGF
jgi:hypothetical protein